MTTTDTTRPGVADRVFDAVERVGNKLPAPFGIFVWLFLITGVVTTAMQMAGASVTVPGTEDGPLPVRGLFTGEGLVWLTTNLGANFIGFPPLLTVLPILLAVGVAQYSGMLNAAIRRAFASSPRWLLPYAVAFVGVGGNLLGDTAFIVIPPLAALVFKAAGRHPVAGLLGGFAAAGAGFSTNYLPSQIDANFAGITTAVVDAVPGLGATPVTPVSNYWFNIVSSLLLVVAAGFLIDRVLEPRIERLGIARDKQVDEDGALAAPGAATPVEAHVRLDPHLTPEERRGLIAAGIALVVTVLVLAVAFLAPASPWRNEDGGYLPSSPLLGSIVFIIFTILTATGIAYGIAAGTIRSTADVGLLMEKQFKAMSSFLVLSFVLGQFVALFSWSGLGSWIAVNGAEGLQAAGLTGYGAILAFVALASVVNLFVISGSAMWTIMAAVFVPMFGLIGYEPAFTQAAFRIGDSATQIITPMNAYIVVLLGMLREYEPRAGLGTVIARLLPFTVVFWILWTAVLTVFFALDLPIGPGTGVRLD